MYVCAYMGLIMGVAEKTVICHCMCYMCLCSFLFHLCFISVSFQFKFFFFSAQKEREETTQDTIVTKSAAFASYEINLNFDKLAGKELQQFLTISFILLESSWGDGDNVEAKHPRLWDTIA
jgi:hypothetical protein